MSSNRNNEIISHGIEVDFITKHKAFFYYFDKDKDGKTVITDGTYIWDVRGKCYTADDEDLPPLKDIVAIHATYDEDAIWVSSRAADYVIDSINQQLEFMADSNKEIEIEAAKEAAKEAPITLNISWYSSVTDSDPLYLEIEANHPDLLVLLRDFDYLNSFPKRCHDEVIADLM